MHSSLRGRLARLGPIRDIDRVPFGSPATVDVHLPETVRRPRTVSAALSLAKRGATMLVAKRAMDQILLGETVRVDLPTVEDVGSLLEEPAASGIVAVLVDRKQASGLQATDA